MRKKTAQKNRRQAYLFMLISTLCWGAALIIVKPAFAFTTPFRFLLYRYLIAGVFFSLPYLYKNRLKLKKNHLIKIILIELFGTVFSLSILYLGLEKTSAIEASLISSSGPLFITLAGIILLKERQERWEWLGLFLSLLGSILIITTTSGPQTEMSSNGNMLIIIYNIMNALYCVLAKKYYHSINTTLTAAVSFVVGLIGFLLINLFISQGHLGLLLTQIGQDWSYPAVQVASIYMATFGSIIGAIFYIKGQDKIEVSEASVFTYLQPLIYLPLGMLLLHETVYTQQIVGLLIILIGVIVAEKRTHC